jgi:DNA helicase-2/ATP-dependent DNA helicase PcrA
MKNTAQNAVFAEAYKKLNPLQKEAVDTIDGPVMVVAGPGTGKTQVLSLRIANILVKTDTQADGILCLTFTNSGVKAMRERLAIYIGKDSSKVNVFTFHSFGMKIIEEFYQALDLDAPPRLLDDTDAVVLVDEILHSNEWAHLRPRGDATRYFKDLKSLISILKRERMTPEEFLKEIEMEIKSLNANPDNISSRGESKGQLKNEISKKIESLERTREVVKFFELYEKAKKENNLLDYDDVLESLIRIVENSDDARNSIQERYLYVLIDEHQDSSGIQNEFLEKVWQGVEKPNIFVVGDDRQLIYGFGGATLEYFEGFKKTFGQVKLITLVDNYRSTQVILDTSHGLLQSAMTDKKLVSHTKEHYPLSIVECDYPRDEIIACSLDIKEKTTMKNGININDCAILVPKNHQVRSAVTVLRDMGFSVAHGTVDLFSSDDAVSLLRVLKILADPYDSASLAQSFFDRLTGISPLAAHAYVKSEDMRKFSLVSIVEKEKGKNTGKLFPEDDKVMNWIAMLGKWFDTTESGGVYATIQKIGEEFLLDSSKTHDELISRVEIIRTLLHLALSQIEKNPKLSLREFLDFIDRLESYGEEIPLAVFGAEEGIKVLTLHGSKGLEFDYVWIAHMDERSFSSGRKQGFSLPESVEEKIQKRGEEVQKRELYVAITRAKRFCSISYSLHSYKGIDQELAHIIADMPEDFFEHQKSADTEKIILANDPKDYVSKKKYANAETKYKELVQIVSKEYTDRNVSVSLLNNFYECPWKWYFRNLLQLPEPTTESLEFGNAVHCSIDRILKAGKMTMKEVEDIVTYEVERREYGDTKKKEQIKKEVFGIVSKWVKDRLPELSIDRENEKSVSVRDDSFPHLNIYGKIDLIERLGKDTVRVTDFKTGGVRKKSDIEKLDEEGRLSGYLRQLGMYSYLIKESTKGNSDVRESRLEFVESKNPKENFYDTVISSAQISLLIKDIGDYDSLVKKGDWLARPCNFNSYGKNTECEYCALAKRIYE